MRRKISIAEDILCANLLHGAQIFVLLAEITTCAMKATLTTISEKTGYSVSTVSRVLNGKSGTCRISAKAVEAIMAEARRCNYSPNSLAQSLRTNKTRIIGVILPSVTNPFFAEMSGSIISEVKNRGYTAIVAVSMENEAEQESCVAALLSKKVEGIIAAPCGSNPRLFEELCNVIPVVFVDRFYSGLNLPYVTSNNYMGSVNATVMLINNGHRNIACIQGSPVSLPNKKRVEGYLKAMRQSGLEENAVLVGDEFSVQCGYLETKLLLSRDVRPTAIFALSYTIALGVMKALQDSGLKIGEDISLVSFDDNVSLDYMVPAITRISQPVEEMGKLATKILIDRIENDTAKSPQLELTTKVIVRESVRTILPAL